MQTRQLFVLAIGAAVVASVTESADRSRDSVTKASDADVPIGAVRFVRPTDRTP
jgi:hypothetical protein